MNKELVVEKAKNGFIVSLKGYSGKKAVFATMRELVAFLEEFFKEGA